MRFFIFGWFVVIASKTHRRLYGWQAIETNVRGAEGHQRQIFLGCSCKSQVSATIRTRAVWLWPLMAVRCIFVAKYPVTCSVMEVA